MATQNQEMSCKELVELLTLYFEETLSLSDRLRFDQHLALCQGCRVYLDQMRTMIRTLGSLREESIPLQAREDLLRVFRTWKD